MESSQGMTKKSCIHEAIRVEKVFSNLTFMKQYECRKLKKNLPNMYTLRNFWGGSKNSPALISWDCSELGWTCVKM